MKELVKPTKVEEQLQNIEAYCDNGVCNPQYGVCPSQAGCAPNAAQRDDEINDILF